MQITVIQEVV